MLIGLDFDNTLICYDHAFSKVGKAAGLLGAKVIKTTKADVKRHLLEQDPSGQKWETLQGLVYGRFISEATLFPGVIDFLQKCRNDNVRLKVISHKTLLAHHDPEKTNLRDAALAWMTTNGFFSSLGFEPEDILFGETRDEKLEHIEREACDVFIDDLPEVLEDNAMRKNCRAVLFGTESHPRLKNYANWPAVTKAFFG